MYYNTLSYDLDVPCGSPYPPVSEQLRPARVAVGPGRLPRTHAQGGSLCLKVFYLLANFLI